MWPYALNIELRVSWYINASAYFERRTVKTTQWPYSVWIFPKASMKTVVSLTRSSLLCLFLPSIFSAFQNSTSTELTPICDRTREKIKEEMLPIILCGCSDVVLRSTANGFSALVLLQRGFWIGLKSLHARNARFTLFSQPASILNVLGDIELKEIPIVKNG